MTTEQNRVREQVRDHYGKVAETPGTVGCTPGCCVAPVEVMSQAIGYSADEVAAVPEGANLGLGCGNPQAIAALRPGERVLDLGSGAGFDCFLAARQVGDSGRVIGVDMTAQMVARARANAVKVKANNVEFRLGEIERLPVADASVDVILSNCVINLSPDKASVFREAFRVLAPGGRLAISDVVEIAPLPEALRASAEALTGCVAGAASIADLERMMRAAGFVEVSVKPRAESADFIRQCFPETFAEKYVASATIEGKKPGTGASCCAPSCCS